ncbi:MAG: translation initiation factor IF-3 [Gemmatimonadetes bacterium]|nr:translation initiation factor IF-3 [Gemmatimonadota bacterium]
MEHRVWIPRAVLAVGWRRGRGASRAPEGVSTGPKSVPDRPRGEGPGPLTSHAASTIFHDPSHEGGKPQKWAATTGGPTLGAPRSRARVASVAGGRAAFPPTSWLRPELARVFFVGVAVLRGPSCRNHIGGGDISEKRVRVNEQIRISPVRLIGDAGEQIGIVSIDEARERATERGLDLVEVAPDARPPVVKMMDYGKYKYEAARAAREARKKQHTIQVKEVKFRPGIEEHDYDFKIRHARRFLEEGNKVKLTMMFRGRQVTHPELGLEILSRVTEDLVDIAKVEQNASFEGRQMSMVISPLKIK